MNKDEVKELAHRYDEDIVDWAYSAGWSDGYASAKNDYGKSKGRTTVHRATQEQRKANHTPDLSGWCECGRPILGPWSGFINFCPWCGKIIDWADSDVDKPDEAP